MKKIILILALAGMLVQSNAQMVIEKDVPVVIVHTFTTAYPTVTDVDWNKEGDYYVASYEVNEVPMFVVYNRSGTYIQSRERIKASALPTAIMSYIKTNYKEDEVRKAYKLTDANGTLTYKVKVKGNYLLFDANGNYVNSLKM